MDKNILVLLFLTSVEGSGAAKLSEKRGKEAAWERQSFLAVAMDRGQ